MDRTACVELPAFPLQLLLRRHPDWREVPAAVVDQDRPQGKLLWVNEAARALRVLPGMRYAAALGLARELRAAELSEETIRRAIDGLARRLRYFTPDVEPCREEPGLFWLDASGFERLHDSLGRWARLVHDDLKRGGYEATLVVGYGRFGSYALAKGKRGVQVLSRPADESAAARRVPLERMALEPKDRDTLARLGVRTVGELVDLPPDGIESRFGPALARLHRLARGVCSAPLQPEHPEPTALAEFLLDDPEPSALRLMVVIEPLLDEVLATLESRRERAAELRLRFVLDSGGEHVEALRPAAPTRNARQLLDLLRLRLQALRRLPDGVVEVALAALGVEVPAGQLELFAERPRRDLEAANRALARVRAELGDRAVTRAEPCEGHLPEARFRWSPLQRLSPASPDAVAVARLIRRIRTQPYPLPPRPRQEPDGWMLRDLTDGPVIRVEGPHVVSGGWWRRAVHREYVFAETQRGELLWAYYDRVRRRWYLHGRVE